MGDIYNIRIEDLPSYISNNQKKITYISIGCANIRYEDTDPPENDRQQYPLFLEQLLKKNKFDCRIILIDPLLENFPYIFHHFNEIYVIDPYENIFICDNGHTEIILIKERIDHDHPYFASQEMQIFNLLNLIIMEQDGVLIVQDYCGFDLIPVADYYYHNLPNELKEKYSTKILYDFTYGINYGCMVDLSNIDNLPIIHVIKDEPIIINPLILDSKHIHQILIRLTNNDMKKILNIKVSYFKNNAFPIFRKLKILLFDDQNEKIINENENKMEEIIFTKHKLLCYSEYLNFCMNPNMRNRELFENQLNTYIVHQFDELMFFFDCQSYQSTIDDLRKKITVVNNYSIYQWYNEFIKIINQLLAIYND